MPRPIAPPRLVFWKGRWHIFYTEVATRKPKRVSCAALRPDKPKLSPDDRVALLVQITAQQTQSAHDLYQLGGVNGFETPVAKAVDTFIAHVKTLAKVRAGKPGTREGLSTQSAYMLTYTAELFRDWCTANGNPACGRLDRPTLERFMAHLASKKGNNILDASKSTGYNSSVERDSPSPRLQAG